MTTEPRPSVRSLLLCEDIVADPGNSNRISLMYLVSNISPVAGAAYPLIRPRLCVFAQLTECRGQGALWAEVRQADTDRALFRTPGRVVTFPGNPLAVHGVSFRLRNLVFPAPGLYWVQLWYSDALLGEHPLTLK
jgi:hypothetical protein